MGPIDGIDDVFLSQGLPGAICLVLGYFIVMLRKELREAYEARERSEKALRDSHRTEIAVKDQQIAELQEARLREMREGISLAVSTKATLEAFTLAVRGRE